MNITENDLLLILKQIKDYSGYDFFSYSRKSLLRRFDKILEDYSCTANELYNKIQNNPLIIENIIKNITVNTTEFFRDPIVWIELEEKVIPEFEKREKINIWNPGCSYGHESYSLLIMLNEHNLLERTTITSTDINADVLNTAKLGMFRYSLDYEYLKNMDIVFNRPGSNAVPYEKYFYIDEKNQVLNIRSDFLNIIRFYKHDLVLDPYPTEQSFDLIMCRNVLIYFNTDLQNKLLYFFHKTLKPNSYLILGYHETILGTMSGFYNKNGNIYRKA